MVIATNDHSFEAGTAAGETARADDAALAAAIADGHHASLRTAYDLYASRVMGVAMGILKNKELAEDVTQEVFVRLWNNPHRFNAGRGSLKAYLQVDARGRSIDLIRSLRAAAQRDQADYYKSSNQAVGTEDMAMTSLTSATVREAILGLPEDQRAPIALAYLDGHSYRDVADHLGLPEGTVKSRIRAGMRRLHLTLAHEVG